MKLVNVAVARSVWLFSLEELNPRGVRLNPTVALALEDHYDFQRQKRPERPNEGLQFTGGAFTADGVEVNVNLQVSEDRYYSRATLGTEAHLSLLEEFEAVLAPRGS